LELIDNKYQVLRTLGKGGCGIVYVCWSEALNKEVAVKVLHDQMHSQVILKRFRNEAQSLMLCKHPCVVQCLNFGISPEGNPYFVMDYVPGISLSEELNQNGPLSPPRFAKIFRDVLSALECAHEAGLVHRDLKPSNILITHAGDNERAVLIDFGLIKQLEGQKLTATSSLLGTPQYMSPEQCKGGDVDIRSDLYSIGCTMYQAATGHPLYEGEAMETLLCHVQSEPQGIPAVLAPLLNRLLDKDRTKRFSNASEASACLADLDLASTMDFKATISQAGQRTSKPIGQGRLRTLVLFAAPISVLLFGFQIMGNSFDEKGKREPTASEIQSAQSQSNNLVKMAAEHLKERKPEQAMRDCDEAIQVLTSVQRQDTTDILWPLSLKLRISRDNGLTHKEDIALANQGIAIAKESVQYRLQERHLYIEKAWRLQDSQQFQAAEEAYDAALKLMVLKLDPVDEESNLEARSNATLLAEYAQLRDLCGMAPKGTIKFGQIASQVLEECRKNKLANWTVELQVNHLLTRLSRDKAQLMAIGDRMQKAAEDKQLTAAGQTVALVAAGMAFGQAEDKPLALKLMRRAKDNDLRHGKPPYAGAAHAIHAMLDQGLIKDPHEKLALASFAYNSLQPYRNAHLDAFMTCSSHLAVALQETGRQEEAKRYYREAAEIAEKSANSHSTNQEPRQAENYYAVSLDNYVQCARDDLAQGKYASAQNLTVRCQQLLKKVSAKSRQLQAPGVEQLSKELVSKSGHFAE